MRSVKELTLEIQKDYSLIQSRMEASGYVEYFTAKTKKQIDEELLLLQKDRTCKSDSIDAFPFLEGFKAEQIGKILRDEPYNVNFLEGFRCALNIIIDDKTSGVSMREKIHEFIEEPDRFGTESVNGFALKSGLDTNASTSHVNSHRKKKIDCLVLKCPRNPFKSTEMVHEMIVCLEALNKLRALDPPVMNFSYGYESFTCGGPIAGKNKKVVEWCLPGSTQVAYALYENVYNPIPMSNVKNGKEFILYYIHCVLGLKIANELYDFTHYDAHHENVLLMDYSNKSFYVEFNFNGKRIFVKSKGRIPMFIDYGMSHIKVTSETNNVINCGIIDPNGGFAAMGIPSDQSNCMSDTYKLVCMVMTFTNKKDVKDMCRKILGYFYGKLEITVSEMNYIMAQQWNARFHIPKNIIDPSWNMTDLAIHCITIAVNLNKDYVVSIRPKNVLGCGEFCRSKEQSLKMISEDNINIPTAFDLYETRNDPIFQELLSRFQSNPQATYNFEELKMQPFLTTNYNEKFYPVKDDQKFIYSHKDTIMKSIVNIAKTLEDLNNLNKNIEYIKLCHNYQPNLFRMLLTRLIQKQDYIMSKILTIFDYIISGQNILAKIVFGVNKSEYTSDEISLAQKHNLYDLSATYNDVLGIMRLLANNQNQVLQVEPNVELQKSNEKSTSFYGKLKNYFGF